MNELILPWPDKRLSPNARVHWSKRSGAARLAGHLGAITALEAGCKGWALPEARLARFKPYRDAIADALGIDDKRFISHPVESSERWPGGQAVVRITGGPEAADLQQEEKIDAG